MIFNCLRNREEKQLQLYLFLSIITSGKIKSDDIDYNELSRVLGIKTHKTIKCHLNALLQRNWIGYSNKSKNYFIRGFDKIKEIEKITTKTAAVFSIEYFSNFKAWCGSILYAYLYRKTRWSKYKKSASYKEKASQTIYTAPLFLPVATTGCSKFYKISVGQASKLKKLAFEAGFIDVRKNYKNSNIVLEEKELFKKYGDTNLANKVRVRNGQVVFQEIDTILPRIALSKRKKRKT